MSFAPFTPLRRVESFFFNFRFQKKLFQVFFQFFLRLFFFFVDMGFVLVVELAVVVGLPRNRTYFRYQIEISSCQYLCARLCRTSFCILAKKNTRKVYYECVGEREKKNSPRKITPRGVRRVLSSTTLLWNFSKRKTIISISLLDRNHDTY